MTTTQTYNEREIKIRRVRKSFDRIAYAVSIDGEFAFNKASKQNALHNAKLWIDQNAFCLNGKWIAI
jgi:hypothetical protein